MLIPFTAIVGTVLWWIFAAFSLLIDLSMATTVFVWGLWHNFLSWTRTKNERCQKHIRHCGGACRRQEETVVFMKSIVESCHVACRTSTPHAGMGSVCCAAPQRTIQHAKNEWAGRRRAVWIYAIFCVSRGFAEKKLCRSEQSKNLLWHKYYTFSCPCE